ncbi:hypothetical protein ID866_9111 [Astraeus odoratus]|nr:hypothetical protein ID866_9111 [Astraeus odoratus]
MASFRAPCSHHFCPECAIEMVEAASRDPQLLPLQCCKVLLPVDPLVNFLPQRRRTAIKYKLMEASVPPTQRLYCPKQTCSVFMGESAKNERPATELTCPKCYTRVCTSCKNIAHPGDTCKQNSLAIMVRELAASNKWQTCPGCKMIVERTSGCPHMACRCGTAFCYCCGTAGKCPVH